MNPVNTNESWRLLRLGELLRSGDQYLERNTGWIPVTPRTSGFGLPIGPMDGVHRRRSGMLNAIRRLLSKAL